MVWYNNEQIFLKGGTGYFSSKQVHCEGCLQRENKRTGEITYSHQLLGVALVHPDQQAVIPLAPEPIIKQDGQQKNDCERNAAKRLLAKLRQDHPRLPLIIIEDALSANGRISKNYSGTNFVSFWGSNRAITAICLTTWPKLSRPTHRRAKAVS